MSFYTRIKTKVIKFLGLAGICSVLLFNTGCSSFSSYMSLALQFAVNAAQIYTVASGHTVNTMTWQTKEQDIITLEQGFVKGTTAIGDVNAAIADFQNNITSALDLVSIKNNATKNMITAILGLVNTNILLAETFFAKTPSQAPIVSGMTKASAKVAIAVHVTTSPIPSIRQLKKQYNAIVSVDTGDLATNNIAHNSTF